MIYTPCQNTQKTCKFKHQLLKQQQLIKLLNQQLQNQRQQHLLQVKHLYEKIQAYMKEKQVQMQQRNEMIVRYKQKNRSNKVRYGELCEKMKEQAQKLRNCVKSKREVEEDNRRLKEMMKQMENSHEQTKVYVRQLKEVIHLLEKQGLELRLERNRLKEEVGCLKRQITNYHELSSKFTNIEQISQTQYQKQIFLLKNELQQQFNKNISNVFDNCIKNNELTKTSDFDSHQKSTKNQAQQIMQQLQGQLQQLTNCIDYGPSYFLLQSLHFNRSQLQKLYKYMINEIKIKNQLMQEMKVKDRSNSEVIDALRGKLVQFEESICEMRELNRREFSSKEVQTSGGDKQKQSNNRVNELVNLHNGLKIKNYSLQNIIGFMSEFVIYLLQIIKANIKKQFYYHFCQHFVHQHTIIAQPQTSTYRSTSTSKFKAIAKAILFIKIIQRKAHRSKNRNAKNDMSRVQNIGKFIVDGHLSNLLRMFVRRSVDRNYVKNHRIEEISRSKCQIVRQQAVFEILNQEYLNRNGEDQNRYEDCFRKFIYGIQNGHK